jgi:hypothetical protein
MTRQMVKPHPKANGLLCVADIGLSSGLVDAFYF